MLIMQLSKRNITATTLHGLHIMPTKQKQTMQIDTSKTTMFPLFKEQAHPPSNIKHFMSKSWQAVAVLNLK